SWSNCNARRRWPKNDCTVLKRRCSFMRPPVWGYVVQGGAGWRPLPHVSTGAYDLFFTEDQGNPFRDVNAKMRPLALPSLALRTTAHPWGPPGPPPEEDPTPPAAAPKRGGDAARMDKGNQFDAAGRFDYPYREVWIDRPDGTRVRLDAYDHENRLIVSRKYTQ